MKTIFQQITKQFYNFFWFLLMGFSFSLDATLNTNERVDALLTSLNIKNLTAINISLIGDHIKIEYTLPETCSLFFNSLLQNSDIDPYKNWETYRHFAQEKLSQVLPDDLRAIIFNMRTNNEPTVLIVHNMPVDNYIPPTPTHGNRPNPKKFDLDGKELHDPQAKGYVSETILLGMCNLLSAFPDFDENEKDGTYINQIIPVDDINYKQKASSFGSEIKFEFHTENVYQATPLKYLTLLCLRGDPKVATSFVFLDAILESMKQNPHPTISHEEIINEMEKPQFLMKTGPSFKNSAIQTLLPILCRNKKGERVFRFNANTDRIVGTNAKSTEVVEYIRNILTSAQFKEQFANRIYLKTGDFILLNNWEVMHARDAFKIDPNNWRWLQRCYFMLREQN